MNNRGLGTTYARSHYERRSLSSRRDPPTSPLYPTGTACPCSLPAHSSTGWRRKQSSWYVYSRTITVPRTGNLCQRLGFTVLPVLLLVLVGSLMHGMLIGFGLGRFPGGTPLAAICSLVIAAACRRPRSDAGPAYMAVSCGARLRWKIKIGMDGAALPARQYMRLSQETKHLWLEGEYGDCSSTAPSHGVYQTVDAEHFAYHSLTTFEKKGVWPARRDVNRNGDGKLHRIISKLRRRCQCSLQTPVSENQEQRSDREHVTGVPHV